jgi:hypothetical protein
MYGNEAEPEKIILWNNLWTSWTTVYADSGTLDSLQTSMKKFHGLETLPFTGGHHY